MSASASTSKATTKGDFEQIRANLQKSVLETTKLASQIPAPSDLRFQRTLSRPLGKKVDQASKRLLHITSRVLDLAKQAQGSNINNDKGKKAESNAAELQEEDVVDGYQNRIVKVTDYLLEQIDKNLDDAFQSAKKGKQAQEQSDGGPIASTSRAAQSSTSAASRDYRNAGNIRKPQLDFKGDEYNTSSSTLFRPLLSSKPHAIEPLNFDTTPYTDPNTGIETSRVPNPYLKEIQAAVDKPFPELENPYEGETVEIMSSQMDKKPFLFVDTVEKLAECLDVLKEAKVIAIDLEHHDLRTYRGITCLMQISTTTHDYIVDPLVPAVRSTLHTLNEAFANPDIIKVFHGADWDIIWLQRDFGLYIVNLFDTYHASRAINRLTGHSLASLLKEYTTFLPEKKYQLADWRIRPLTEELVKYARSDTHFLIYIFFAILNNPAMTPEVLQDVRRRSAATASQVYYHPVYDFEDGQGSGGWRRLADRSGKLQIWGIDNVSSSANSAIKTQSMGVPEPWKWTDKQGRAKFEVFRSLHAWRDRVAREEDESTGYILSNKNLIAIAERIPQTMADLVYCLGSDMKGAIAQRSQAILEEVATAKTRAEEYLKEQEMVQNAGMAPDTQASAASTIWARDTASTNSNSSASTNSASAAPRRSAFSSLFPTNHPAPRETSAPSSSAFSNVVKKVHHALLEQLQPASAAILGRPSAADVVVKEEEEVTALPPAKKEEAQEDSGIVQVSSRKKDKGKKRKSPDTEQVAVSSSSATGAANANTSHGKKKPAYVKPFDYTGVKSVLDEPMEEQKPRKRPKKVRGTGADQEGGSEGPTFKRPPKSMNQPKHGNKSHTFV